MLKRLLVVAALVATLGSAGALSSVGATGNGGNNGNGQNNGGSASSTEGVCEGLTSGKIDVTGSKKTITIVAPEGYVITAYCVKAGSVQQGDGPEYTRNISVASITISHSTGKDISHYSYTLAPKQVELKADVKYTIVCEVLTQEAKITFSNTGTKAGQVELNGSAFTVAAGASIEKTIPVAVNGTKITVKIDGMTKFDEVYKCVGGQGGVVNPTPTPAPTPVVATPSPVAAGAGQSATVATPATTSKESAIASLPYTAGNGLQSAVLIASLAAILTAIIAVIAKKTYLKQV